MTNVNEFLGELASNSPTPGGGSVAALAGALGAALASMVCNLTIGKKKYADVEDQMSHVLEETEALRLELAQFIDEDALAFDRVMEAMRLPKETDEEKATRKARIQDALVEAASVPLAVMGRCVAVIRLARLAAESGNVNAVSDAGVAALLGRAGAHAARLNVLINLGGIRAPEHADFVERATTGIADLAEEADRAAEEVLGLVEEKIG